VPRPPFLCLRELITEKIVSARQNSKFISCIVLPQKKKVIMDD
jgi:hypothetical protein